MKLKNRDEKKVLGNINVVNSISELNFIYLRKILRQNTNFVLSQAK